MAVTDRKGLRLFGYRGSGKDQDCREETRMPGAALGSFRAISQLLISSVCLKGCGGDDSSSFLAKILLEMD